MLEIAVTATPKLCPTVVTFRTLFPWQPISRDLRLVSQPDPAYHTVMPRNMYGDVPGLPLCRRTWTIKIVMRGMPVFRLEAPGPAFIYIFI